MIEARDIDLVGKIFTMDKMLSGQKLDEMVGRDFDFKKEIKDLQAMKDMNYEVMATFKFFKI